MLKLNESVSSSCTSAPKFARNFHSHRKGNDLPKPGMYPPIRGGTTLLESATPPIRGGYHPNRGGTPLLKSATPPIRGGSLSPNCLPTRWVADLQGTNRPPRGVVNSRGRGGGLITPPPPPSLRRYHSVLTCVKSGTHSPLRKLHYTVTRQFQLQGVLRCTGGGVGESLVSVPPPTPPPGDGVVGGYPIAHLLFEVGSPN